MIKFLDIVFSILGAGLLALVLVADSVQSLGGWGLLVVSDMALMVVVAKVHDRMLEEEEKQ